MSRNDTTPIFNITMKLLHNGHRWQLVFLLLVMASPAFAGTLIETYGHFPVARTSWTIDVSAHGLTFDLITHEKTAIFGLITLEKTELKESPPDWKPHPGWFVFVEDSDMWAYDGADTILVQVVTSKKIIGYGFAPHRDMADTWGDIPNPPKEVFDRLPPRIQAVIRQKFPQDL
jgi:hypothetical protein